MNPIYLDSNATTPIDGRVKKAMEPYLWDKFGNASSSDNLYGQEAATAVEAARRQVADAIGAKPNEIIFTSGATESDNLAIIGTMDRHADKGNHIITCTTEHAAVLDTVKHLESVGKNVTHVPVDCFGFVDPKLVEESITPDTVMISIMAANNEIGTIADFGEIGRIAHKHGILFHTDAAQAVGHIPIDVEKAGIDLMSMSAHKMYGPKGAGALYMRGIKPRTSLVPITRGGGQENGLRPGTLNVPAIVGLGKSIEIAMAEMAGEERRYREWFDMMVDAFAPIDGTVNGSMDSRIMHNLSVRFDGVDGKAIIGEVSGRLAISAGSACTSINVEPSHVLLAIGLDDEAAHSTIRIGMGRLNTKYDIDIASGLIVGTVKRLRNIGSA